MCHFALSLPSLHIFETSGWDNITFGSQGDIGIIHIYIVSQTLTLGWPRLTFNILLGGGGASAGKPFSFELKTKGEKVGYCQSLPSDFVLLGASFSVY